MIILGQASSGGPIHATGVPIPKAPLTQPGSDIVSRLEATHNRVSPVGADAGDSESTKYVLGSSSRRSRRGATPRFDRVEIAARYRRGASAREIADTLGCQIQTVYAALKDQGVERRPKGRAA